MKKICRGDGYVVVQLGTQKCTEGLSVLLSAVVQQKVPVGARRDSNRGIPLREAGVLTIWLHHTPN